MCSINPIPAISTATVIISACCSFADMIGLPLLFAEAVFPRRSGCLRLSGNTRRYELTNVLAHLFGG
jgi:hypothetical protein